MAILAWLANICAWYVQRLAFLLYEHHGNYWVSLYFYRFMVGFHVSQNIKGFYYCFSSRFRCISGWWFGWVRYKCSVLHIASMLRLGRSHGHK